MKTILAIEASTEQCSVALLSNGKIITKANSVGIKNSQNLLPTILQILDENNINLQSINLIAISNGPGSFTSIRVAVSVAKALSFSLNIKVVVYDTLTVLAQTAFDKLGLEKIVACIDARMGEIYSAEFKIINKKAILQGPLQVINPIKLNIKQDYTYVGTGVESYKEYFVDINKYHNDALIYPHAKALISLIGDKVEQDRLLDAEQVIPCYLRNNIAT